MASTNGQWPRIPNDVISWFREIFAGANVRLSETLLNAPSSRETTLDDVFVNALIPYTAPRKFGSGAVVRLDVHNIGGLRRYQSWEIGDIALISHIVRRSKIIASKVAVLQAKRLFPSVGEIEDEDELGFLYGMNQWLRRDPAPTSMALVKQFTFDQSSKYNSLASGSDQVKAIDGFSQRFGNNAVYYLMYNPHKIPLSIEYPVKKYKQLASRPRVGARVYRKDEIHAFLNGKPKGRSPTFGDVSALGNPTGGWRVEDWASREFLRCRVGRPFSAKEDETVASMLSRRSGPIGAAIQVSIELSPE